VTAQVHPGISAGDRLPRGKARVHSRLVRVLRILLPLTMVGVIALLVTLVVAHAIKRQAAAHRDAATPIRMVNPHFYGRDTQGRAYTLTATQATRDDLSFQRVLLDYPSVTLDVDGPSPSTLTADTGVYHEDTRVLFLRGHVRADDAHAASFATDQAVVNTRTGIVNGGAPLSTRTKTGVLNARSFDAYDKGDRMVFKGGVHATLNGR
jgi:lipopolysaccharide export system protein LptC